MKRSLGLRTGAALAAGSCVALAFGAFAFGAPKPGIYSGKTSEASTVSLSVSTSGKTITGFSTTLGYDRECRYKGGAGGFPTYTVKVPSMSISTTGAFTATVMAPGMVPFKTPHSVTVSGKAEGAKASGSVTAANDPCGTYASNPKTLSYTESFSATAG